VAQNANKGKGKAVMSCIKWRIRGCVAGTCTRLLAQAQLELNLGLAQLVLHHQVVHSVLVLRWNSQSQFYSQGLGESRKAV
jgi:hypothetical protein